MMLTSSGPSPHAAGNMPSNLDLTLLEDVSRQMASSNLSRRHSKGASGPRIGGSMRISKANSTNNSPRNSTTLNRRRTVMGDSYRRQPAAAVNQGMSASGEPSQAYLTPLQAVSQTRPVSWHPSAYSTYDVPFQPVYNQDMTDYNMSYSTSQDLPHTPALQSNYGSPSAAFSPESQPWTSYDQDYQLYDTSFMQPSFDNGAMADYNVYSQYQLQLAAQTQQTSYNDCMNPSIYSHFDWNNYASTGFEDGTAPPTPENFLPIQHPEPPCAIETTIPYHSLDDQEDEGEILVGMGLYDTPDKPSLPDVQLEQYRTAMISQYLGSTTHRATAAAAVVVAESTGKGLKLEETWNPPPSEDGEDEDQDAEGSDDDEEEEAGGRGQGSGGDASARNHVVVDGAVVQQYGEGWL
ncbi:hypothetical protein V493_03279 [Pseudogymnoascus sp. VKM F-4281 (FW-2241)]|nr:hypothetical protein V493_03279 [Pseudogymnoascus sp. VKM F-4281 (FW-2241)]